VWIILCCLDDIVSFGEVCIWLEIICVDVWVVEVPNLWLGDWIEIDGELFLI